MPSSKTSADHSVLAVLARRGRWLEQQWRDRKLAADRSDRGSTPAMQPVAEIGHGGFEFDVAGLCT